MAFLGPSEKVMIIDFDQLEPSQRYFAMVQAIIPRPIAWVLSDNGVSAGAPYNLAPFSFFTGVCSDPPLLMLSIGKKAAGGEAGQVKDTRLNIHKRSHFVVHMASTAQMQALNQSAATLAHGDSELHLAGLATVPFAGFALPRLRDCTIAMGCSLYRMDEIGHSAQAVVYGKIETFFVDDALLIPHENRLIIDPHKLDPLARLGGNEYAQLGEVMTLRRPV